MSTDLREELDALARTQTFSPDPSAWDRGRRARVVVRVSPPGLAAVAVVAVVAGAGALALQPDREARTASSEVVEGGAIPSRIEDIPADLEPTTDLAVGRGAAAFISTSQRDPVVVTAADGVAHRLDLPGWSEDGQALALSPDGMNLAWQQTGRRWRHHQRAGADDREAAERRGAPGGRPRPPRAHVVARLGRGWAGWATPTAAPTSDGCRWPGRT